MANIRKIETKHIGTLYIDEYTEPDKSTPYDEARIYIYDCNKKPIDFFSFESFDNEADKLGCTVKDVYDQIVREIKSAKTVEGFFNNVFMFSAELITDCVDDLFEYLDCKSKEDVIKNEFVVVVNSHYILLRE